MKPFSLLLSFAMLLVINQGFSQNYDITFRVDMNQYPGTYTVNVNGTFNGWCGSCDEMTDPDMDGIYEIMVPIPAGNIQYAFTINGSFLSQENLGPQQTCTITDNGYILLGIWALQKTSFLSSKRVS